MNRRGTQRRRSTVTSIVMAALVVFATAACGSDDASDASSGSRPNSSVSKSVSDPQSQAAIAVCRQAITSAGVMVRDYNNFIKKLNQTQDYKQIGKEDRYARDTLETGSELVRKTLTPEVPDDIADKAEAFLSATDQLAEQIKKRNKLALNKGMDGWSDKRTDLIDSCGAYLPTGVS